MVEPTLVLAVEPAEIAIRVMVDCASQVPPAKRCTAVFEI